MTPRIVVAIYLASLSLGPGLCVAQTSDTSASKDKTPTESSGASAIEAIEVEYRELICARAADPSDKLQQQSIELALDNEFVDERFDSLIRSAMQDVAQPGNWNVSRVTQAAKLLPLSTLVDEERTELIFQPYLASGDTRADVTLRRDLRSYLQSTPDLTSRLVHDQLRKGDRSDNLFHLLGITGTSTEASLPLLMQIAKTDDPDSATWAMSLIPDVIASVKARDRKEIEQRKFAKRGVPTPDEKFLKYAERIIQRYDSNKDAKLVPDEYAKMLMSPAPADADNDGEITIVEYAAWMQNRTKK